MNVVAAPTPSDVYSSVAVRVEERRKIDEGQGHEIALLLRKRMPGTLPRKVREKDTVMSRKRGSLFAGYQADCNDHGLRSDYVWS